MWLPMCNVTLEYRVSGPWRLVWPSECVVRVMAHTSITPVVISHAGHQGTGTTVLQCSRAAAGRVDFVRDQVQAYVLTASMRDILEAGSIVSSCIQ
jgi:hypothetical protein